MSVKSASVVLNLNSVQYRSYPLIEITGDPVWDIYERRSSVNRLHQQSQQIAVNQGSSDNNILRSNPFREYLTSYGVTRSYARTNTSLT